MHWFQQHMTLKGRIVLFLGAFFGALLVQLNVTNYQSGVVLEQLDRQTGNFHSISQFSSGVESQLTALENFRWENGDAPALAQTLQNAAHVCDAWLWRIDGDLAEAGEEQYLLAQAVRTTYQNYAEQVERLTALLKNGDTRGAKHLQHAVRPERPAQGRTGGDHPALLCAGRPGGPRRVAAAGPGAADDRGFPGYHPGLL